MAERLIRALADRRRRWLLLTSLTFGFLYISWAHDHVVQAAQGRVYATVADVPAREVALVLGTNPFLRSGRRNVFFDYRIDAAAALWRAGKVRILLVSGDNGTDGYDEVTAMRKALVARGVPESAVVRDHAGFRTLDSVVRCLEVFGVRRPIIVSQRWHDERAIYLANQRGLDAIAVAAQDVATLAAPKSRLREFIARGAAVLDIELLHTQPRFPGPPQPIPGQGGH